MGGAGGVGDLPMRYVCGYNYKCFLQVGSVGYITMQACQAGCHHPSSRGGEKTGGAARSMEESGVSWWGMMKQKVINVWQRITKG